jgi:hypothetical protein
MEILQVEKEQDGLFSDGRSTEDDAMMNVHPHLDRYIHRSAIYVSSTKLLGSDHPQLIPGQAIGGKNISYCPHRP